MKIIRRTPKKSTAIVIRACRDCGACYAPKAPQTDIVKSKWAERCHCGGEIAIPRP